MVINISRSDDNNSVAIHIIPSIEEKFGAK